MNLSKVELSTIVTLILAIISGAFYLGNLSSRIGSLEKYDQEFLRNKKDAIEEIDKKLKNFVVSDTLKNNGHYVEFYRGSTIPGKTEWKPTVQEVYLDSALRKIPCIYLDVDLSECNFESAPRVFWALNGNKNLFETRGTNSIYHLTKIGFRIYLSYRDGITPNQANNWGWYVTWLATEK